MAASRMGQMLIDAANSLERFPNRGRPISRGRRELLSVWPYVIRYRVDDDTVIILRVRHGAQRPNCPPQTGNDNLPQFVHRPLPVCQSALRIGSELLGPRAVGAPDVA